MEAILGLLSVSSLLVIGWYWGTRRAKRHAESLDLRERELAYIFVTNLKRLDRANPRPAAPPSLLTVELVWGVDRFQALLAAISNMFGGELDSVSAVMVRTRREAVLRLKAQAQRGGYNAIANLRLEPADIGSDPQNQNLVVAMLGSATAYHRET